MSIDNNLAEFLLQSCSDGIQNDLVMTYEVLVKGSSVCGAGALERGDGEMAMELRKEGRSVVAESAACYSVGGYHAETSPHSP
jgi:hypothetical protein